ncbi:MAG: ATP-grasp domain-containing protein [Thaumarchaeota archaeon]|nr:ATP-grasp domain-containing protein [Nitrososphaerota archaeon]MCL5318647.1 ATP-grasp domain-containing protein [Nitrososphaerota archaeon]
MSNFNIAILHNDVPPGSDPSEDVLDQVEGVAKCLSNLNINYTIVPVGDEITKPINTLVSQRPDAVFNLCEGVYGLSGLEMNMAAVLELLRIPYTGSPSLSLGLCQRKDLAKSVLSANGVPTPKYLVLTGNEEYSLRGLKFPLFVKPVQEDGSIGVTGENVVWSRRQLTERVNHVTKTYKQPALVEEFIDGRELNVALLGNNPPVALPLSEILFIGQEKFVSYNAKWIKASRSYEETTPVCPANLDADTLKKVEEVAISSFRLLRCRDYARVDIRLSGKTPYVLEVNPNPDIDPNAGYACSLHAAGLSLEEFVERVVGYALSRKDHP